MLSKIYGSISLILLFLAPDAMESEMYITSLAMIVGTALFAYLSMKEDGLISKRTKK